MTVVVDASALVDFLTDGPYAGVVDERVQRALAVWAPHLIDAEFGHALRAGVRRGQLTPSAAEAALGDLAVLRLQRAAHIDLLPAAWSLRANVSFTTRCTSPWRWSSARRWSPSTPDWRQHRPAREGGVPRLAVNREALG